MQINLLQMNSMMTNDDDYMGEDERREEKEQGKFGGGAFSQENLIAVYVYCQVKMYFKLQYKTL